MGYNAKFINGVWTQIPDGTPDTSLLAAPGSAYPDINSLLPSRDYQISTDPLLSPQAVLEKSQAATAVAMRPSADVANALIAPQIPILEKSIGEQTNAAKASAQSDFLARGMTGSSSEVQTITRDIPAASAKALAEGEIKLFAEALPIAQRQKEIQAAALGKEVDTSVKLRELVSTEKFNSMSLQQKQDLAKADAGLKITLDQIDKAFQARLTQAKFAFEHAENEANRAIEQQKLDFTISQYRQSRKDAFTKGLTSIAGFIAGGAIAGPAGSGFNWSGAAAGASAGNAAGDIFIYS